MTNLARCAIIAALIPTVSACCFWNCRQSEVKPLAELLGPGWQCMAAPGGLQTTAAIYSLNDEGVLAFEEDLSSQVQITSKPRLIGDLTDAAGVSGNFAISLLTDANGKASVNLTMADQAAVRYGDAVEDGVSASGYKIALDWAKQNVTYLDSRTTLLFIRQAIRAKTVQLLLSDELGARLAVSGTFSEVGAVDLGVNAGSRWRYEIPQKTYEPPITVCMLPIRLKAWVVPGASCSGCGPLPVEAEAEAVTETLPIVSISRSGQTSGRR